jgi:hypothetical protein
MRPRRATAAHLVAGAVKYFAELYELVVIISTAVFAVTFSVEVLNLNPSTWYKLTAIALAHICFGLLLVRFIGLTRKLDQGASANLKWHREGISYV